MTQTYSVRQGDTLSALARRFGTTVEELAKTNNIQNPDKIITGTKLQVPDGFDRKDGAKTSKNTQAGGDVFDAKQSDARQQTQASTTGSTQQKDDAAWRDETTGKQYPSRDGVPLYGQGNADWGKQDLGKGSKTIGQAGCAITACSMAVSKMSGKTITPAEMDQYLDKNNGYSGDSVFFEKTGNVAKTNPPVTANRKSGVPIKDIDKELAAGRPVVIGVDYKGNKKPDHWMTVTSKNQDGTYNVNDPAGGNGKGRMIRMKVVNGDLQSADAQSKSGSGLTYHYTGDAVRFSGGTPKKSPPTTTSTKTETSSTQAAKTVTTNGSRRADDLSGKWVAKNGVDANQYDSLIRESSAKYNVPPRLLKAMIQQESHFDKMARSNKDARGLVQIMPKTWKELGDGNPYDPKTNIDHSAKYLSQLLKRYNGDPSKALAAYNYGMGNYDKAVKEGRQLPLETRNYVTNIMNSYNGRSYK